MTEMEHLFETAHGLRKLSDVLQKTRKNIEELNKSEVIKEIRQYPEGESRDFIIRRKLRYAYKELYAFLKENGIDKNTHITTFLAICCQNLDWDRVFDQISGNIGGNRYRMKDLQGNIVDISTGCDVKSWGSVRRDFDTNFLRFIRNGLAHGKFECDFEENKITLKMWNDTFVCEMPMHFMYTQPYSLYHLADQTQTPDKEHRFFILAEEIPPYSKAFSVVIKNEGLPANADWLSGLPKDIQAMAKVFRKQMDDYEAKHGVKLSAKEKYEGVEKQFFFRLQNHYQDLNKKFEAFKAVAKYWGMKADVCDVIDFKEDVCKNNDFVKIALENMNISGGWSEGLYEETTMPEGKSFYAYFNLFGILATNKNEAELIEQVKTQFAFANMDNICQFADRAYVNLVCNYLKGKFEMADSWKAVPVSQYFMPNSFTTGNSVYDVFQERQNKAYIRNSLVHPDGFVSDGDNYRFIDHDKSGTLVFDGEITRENLLKFTDDILQKFEESYSSSATEEESEAEV